MPSPAPEPRSASPDPADGANASEQVEALVAAWRRGESPRVEEILERHPGLDDEATIRLIFEETSLRREAGQPVDSAEIVARFPRLKSELEALLACQRLLDSAPGPARYPRPGDDLAGCHLLAELGRGAAGRVFLASQPALADRPVVLKVTPGGRDEHLRLARLQHMNIVPLYWEQVLPGRDLQVLCMPALGGASLAQILASLAGRAPADRTGAQILTALDRAQEGRPGPAAEPGPFRRFLARAPYVEAICWVAAGLADGLQYAHDRDLLHLDVKPSNVLLAGDGQPMLLDFHLARAPLAFGEPPPARLGGTQGFMAPEQAEALAAVRQSRPLARAVDGRADVYALGLLLDEALGGRGPGPLRRRNPRVSAGLAAIVRRCLRPDPGDRYPTAGALAADLRRHLDQLPLRGVPDRSPAERWRKWRRRRPDALSRVLALAAAAGAAVIAMALLYDARRQRLVQYDAIMTEARAALDRHDPEAATIALRHGLKLAAAHPWAAGRRAELEAELARARRDAQAAELHRLVDLARFRSGIDAPPPDEARAFLRGGRDLWKARDALLGPAGAPRDPEAGRDLRADLLDFALVWADLRVRTAPADEAPEARAEALRVLDEAEALLGPGPALARNRREIAGEPGPAPADEAEPTTAWEHYDLGRFYLRSGQLPRAAEEFRLGLELRPEDFWLNFSRGLCAYKRGAFAEAAESFGICVALAPRTAECSYHHALALASAGRPGPAEAAYGRALRLDPGLVEAWLNRGVLRYRAGRLGPAADDLEQALLRSRDPSLVGTIRYNLALVALARSDRPSARAHLEAAARAGHLEARKRLDASQ